MSKETYHGYIWTTADAILLFEACRQGLLPRVQHRLSKKEQNSIESGSVFVWDEEETGIKRWTDGKLWSKSNRISGSLHVYKEQELWADKTPDSRRGSDEDQEMDDDGADRYRYRDKQDGLIKLSFIIKTSKGQHLHLISYLRSHADSPRLPKPTTDPGLCHIKPVKGMYPEPMVRGPWMTTPNAL